MTIAKDWVGEVYRFWFEEMKPDAWFHGDPATDQTILVRFLDLYRALAGAPPRISDPRTAVAGVIGLDQFPRNMFRGTPQAYATDAKALALAQAAIGAGLDRNLSLLERQFLYMPFQHSEDRAVQARSLELFASLGATEQLGFAAEHKAIIDRFGRFPHRNAILGRASTPEEIEFLKTAPRF